MKVFLFISIILINSIAYAQEFKMAQDSLILEVTSYKIRKKTIIDVTMFNMSSETIYIARQDTLPWCYGFALVNTINLHLGNFVTSLPGFGRPLEVNFVRLWPHDSLNKKIEIRWLHMNKGRDVRYKEYRKMDVNIYLRFIKPHNNMPMLIRMSYDDFLKKSTILFSAVHDRRVHH